MTKIAFAPAVREKVNLRAALIAATGGGKTYGALRIATEIAPIDKVYVIDSENGRAKLEVDTFGEFPYWPLTTPFQNPAGYTEAMQAAYAAGAEVVILDSISPEWSHCLSLADRFGKWKDVRPPHNAWIEAMIGAPGHLIVTMRAKMKYLVTEDEKGKQKIEPMGLGPIQDDNLPYEFDIVAYLDRDHQATFSNRCRPLDGKTMDIPEAAPIIAEWLTYGEDVPPPAEADELRVLALRELAEKAGRSKAHTDKKLDEARAANRGALDPAWVEEQISAIESALAEREKQTEPVTA